MAEKKTKTTKKEEVVVKEETKKEEKTSTITGLEEKYEIILIYIISILGFIFSLMKDKKVSKTMRFHYNQAGTLWLVNVIFNIAFNIASNFVGIFAFVSYPISVVLFIFTIMALVKGFNGEKYEIPVINDISKSIWGKEEK